MGGVGDTAQPVTPPGASLRGWGFSQPGSRDPRGSSPQHRRESGGSRRLLLTRGCRGGDHTRERGLEGPPGAARGNKVPQSHHTASPPHRPLNSGGKPFLFLSRPRWAAHSGWHGSRCSADCRRRCLMLRRGLLCKQGSDRGHPAPPPGGPLLPRCWPRTPGAGTRRGKYPRQRASLPNPERERPTLKCFLNPPKRRSAAPHLRPGERGEAERGGAGFRCVYISGSSEPP